MNEMNKDKIRGFIKKNWLNIVFLGILSLLIFNPDAKAWVLKGFFAIGLFKADPPKTTATTSPATYNLSFRKTDGSFINTSDLQGKILFINFWADWCPPCRAEMPAIQSLYEKVKQEENILFLLVNVDGHTEKSKKFLSSVGARMPVYEPAGPIPSPLYSGTLPTTLVIGKNGGLLLKEEGVANYDTKEFLLWLKEQAK
jgi:thiol-disulfide isomerase/thioredoxin